MKRISFVAIVCASAYALVFPTLARAQYQPSASASIGSANEWGRDYTHASNLVYDLALELLAPPIGSTRLTVGAEYTAAPGEAVTITYPSGLGSTTSAPNFTFLAATAGVQQQLGNVQLDVAGELGSVKVSRGHTHAGVAGSAGIALPIAGSWHFIVAAHALRWTQNGNAIDAYPITVGLRIE